MFNGIPYVLKQCSMACNTLYLDLCSMEHPVFDSCSREHLVTWLIFHETPCIVPWLIFNRTSCIMTHVPWNTLYLDSWFMENPWIIFHGIPNALNQFVPWTGAHCILTNVLGKNLYFDSYSMEHPVSWTMFHETPCILTYIHRNTLYLNQWFMEHPVSWLMF